eukprot:3084014-Prymnesium_polylepis.3
MAKSAVEATDRPNRFVHSTSTPPMKSAPPCAIYMRMFALVLLRAPRVCAPCPRGPACCGV